MGYLTTNKVEEYIEQNTVGNFSITFGNLSVSGKAQIVGINDKKVEVVIIDEDLEILIGSK